MTHLSGRRRSDHIETIAGGGVCNSSSVSRGFPGSVGPESRHRPRQTAAARPFEQLKTGHCVQWGSVQWPQVSSGARVGDMRAPTGWAPHDCISRKFGGSFTNTTLYLVLIVNSREGEEFTNQNLWYLNFLNFTRFVNQLKNRNDIWIYQNQFTLIYNRKSFGQ